MCFYTEQKSTPADAKKRFGILVSDIGQYYGGLFVNGFSYPNLPIITNKNPDIITTDHTWGLLPSWTKDIDFRKNTLNARIETIDDRASFKNITQNRCLIIATGFYEWRWLDEKGKSKEKYHISSQNDEIFCFAGLYDRWVNPANGDVLNTYTMVTTEANELMKYIHNHKQRMPVILNKKDETAWLDSANKIQDFALPYQTQLVAFPTI
jgi:putative SOS response-associated peptidase YedK